MIEGEGQRVPIRCWADDAADDTLRQLQRVASMPWITEHVAAMADAHVSSGVAVGTVFATEDVVVPGALGSDLGCGVSASRLSIDAPDRGTLERTLDLWMQSIPVGHSLHRGRGVEVSNELFRDSLSTRSLEHSREALARRHLGTLGGGNHFIELDGDADGGLWLLVHSGSRGLGAAIAEHHGRSAGGDLAALEGEKRDAYLCDHAWALDFARANRTHLEKAALEGLQTICDASIEVLERIDIHHNFAQWEDHGGRRLLVHRKGAVHVPAGTRALIPGSMGTASYVVEGLGNAESFDSCSHGAGRVMTRTEARKSIDVRALSQSMRRVVHPQSLARQLVEEAPKAYRDITDVLDAQSDLVKREVRLEPRMVLKG